MFLKKHRGPWPDTFSVLARDGIRKRLHVERYLYRVLAGLAVLILFFVPLPLDSWFAALEPLWSTVAKTHPHAGTILRTFQERIQDITPLLLAVMGLSYLIPSFTHWVEAKQLRRGVIFWVVYAICLMYLAATASTRQDESAFQKGLTSGITEIRDNAQKAPTWLDQFLKKYGLPNRIDQESLKQQMDAQRVRGKKEESVGSLPNEKATISTEPDEMRGVRLLAAATANAIDIQFAKRTKQDVEFESARKREIYEQLRAQGLPEDQARGGAASMFAGPGAAHQRDDRANLSANSAIGMYSEQINALARSIQATDTDVPAEFRNLLQKLPEHCGSNSPATRDVLDCTKALDAVAQWSQ